MNYHSAPSGQQPRPAGRARPRLPRPAHQPGGRRGHRIPRLARRLGAGAAVVALTTALGSCAALSEDEGSGSGSTDGRLAVSTSFYPVAYLAQAIGGDHVTVTSVTPPSVEPHDYELAPKDVTALGEADVIAYVPGFQPSLDDAVNQVSGPEVLDLSDAVNLVHHEGVEDDHDHDEDGDHDEDSEDGDSGHDGEDHGEDHEDGASASATASAEASPEASQDSDHGADSDPSSDPSSDTDGHADEADESDRTDPHFWLDPQRMLSAAQAVEKTLSAADPDHAADYQASLKSLTTSLTELDTSYTDGLATCERTTFVTSHSAFAYLAERYGLTQVSVSGIDPEAEPSPAQLAEVKKVVQRTGTTTIFTEELVSSKTAEALAAETGATTAVLSPVESAPSKGDYVDAMTTNLEALRSGLSCQ